MTGTAVGGAGAEVLIGNRVTPLTASARTTVRNPARTGEVVGEAALGTLADVDAAVRAAHDAFGPWSRTSPHERAAVLLDAVAELRPLAAELDRLLTREQGKLRWESRLDVGGAAHILEYYTGLATELAEERVLRSDSRGTVWLARRPMGVTGVIVPWNSPVYLGFLGIAPALMAGNTVVVKPSELAPLALHRVLRTLAAKLPDGVLNSVPGTGSAGAALVEHPLVRKVFFTGSTETGRRVLAGAAGTLKRVSLELGGNDPALVLDSARITDRLVSELVQGVYGMSGQVCFNVKRIYVHRSHYRDFTDRFWAAVDEITVGDGLDERATMGPLNNRAQLDKVAALVADARATGATVHELGRKLDPATWQHGHFLLPHVVTDIDPRADLVTREQFGPAVPVLPFDTEDEAVAMANDTEYGLAASVWSEDRAHARQLAGRIRSGSVFLNVHRAGASSVDMPFGGFNSSGLGRGHGLPALDACTEPQTVADWTDTSGLPGPAPARAHTPEEAR